MRAAHRAALAAVGALIVAAGGLSSTTLAQETAPPAEATAAPVAAPAAAPADASAASSAISAANPPPAPAAPPVRVPGAVRRELNRAQSLLRAQVAHLPHEDDIELLRESEAVVLRVPARVLFRPDSKSLQIDAATARVLALPERLLRRRHRLTARIEVYTDNIGGTSMNLALSQQRAQTLLQVLRRAGISAQRLQAQGAGLRAAITSNDTPEGRMRNRRVEFVFERTGTHQSAPGAGTPLRPAPAAAPAGA